MTRKDDGSTSRKLRRTEMTFREGTHAHNILKYFLNDLINNMPFHDESNLDTIGWLDYLFGVKERWIKVYKVIHHFYPLGFSLEVPSVPRSISDYSKIKIGTNVFIRREGAEYHLECEQSTGWNTYLITESDYRSLLVNLKEL